MNQMLKCIINEYLPASALAPLPVLDPDEGTLMTVFGVGLFNIDESFSLLLNM